MIEGGVYGGTEVVARFDAFPDRLRASLRRAITKLSIRLTNRIKSKLDGEVLKRRTGLLRRSINQTTIESGDKISGVSSTAISYARAHEYGFDGTVNVRAHLRTIKQAFGRSITPVTFEVRAHPAHMKLPERSFLRSALREMERSGEITNALAAAANEATA